MRTVLANALAFLSSQVFCNVLLVALLVLNVSIHSGQDEILASLKRQEPTPMSSTHTVTVASVSFTFTLTTPWRPGDDGADLAARHWQEVADAKAKITELMGG